MVIVVCMYSYRQRVSLITRCFCLLSELAKVFKRKVRRVEVAHLHNVARALSSPSRCFQLSTNLGKDFFDVVVKNKSNVV